MRLLHTKTLRFEEFFDDKIPHYCILSHRWGDDEVSYQDFLAGHKAHGKGYAKILAACEYASGRRIRALLDSSLDDVRSLLVEVYEWIWIDTCCIDKSSSAELSEAINSMYSWYQSAQICFVYLNDVTMSNDRDETIHMFSKSEWHTRGWTLQELLAPRLVCFLDEYWLFLGTKASLSTTISAVTRISERHLRNLYSIRPEAITVAEKMSWAARRRTSRREDQAYCLLGLFDINMPLLYGEGPRAFQRLQLEIVRSSDDESVFAWDIGAWEPGRDPWNSDWGWGLLAPSPDYFRINLQHADELCRTQNWAPRHPYTVTNKGLEIHVPSDLAKKNAILLPLCCGHFGGGIYAVSLRSNNGEWTRVGSAPDGEQYNKEIGKGLYIVDITKLWNRERLQISGSEVIHVRLTRWRRG